MQRESLKDLYLANDKISLQNKTQRDLQSVGSKMTKQSDLQQLAGKRIGETLELLEFGGMPRYQVDIVRKGMWRLFDELFLTKKVGEYEQSSTAR